MSTATTLHHVITYSIEEAVENREVTLGALLVIGGAFDSTPFNNMTKAAKQHELEDIYLSMDWL